MFSNLKRRYFIVLIFSVLVVLCALAFGACKKDSKVVNVELVDGTYSTEYRVGQTPTLVGAELKLSYENGKSDYVRVTKEMAEVYDSVGNRIAFVEESDINIDDNGEKYAITNQELIAKYQNFIVKASVEILTPDYIEITADGTIKKYNGTKPLEILYIPETVTTKNGQTITITKISSAMGAFRGSSIAGIILPSTLQYIDRNSFSGCSNLRIVQFLADKNGNSSLKAILAMAFKDCIQLESIKLPKSLTTLTSNAFDGCSSLRSIDIEDGCSNYFTPYGTAYSGAVYSKNKISLEDVAYSNAYIWPENKSYSNVQFIDRGNLIETYSGPAGEIVDSVSIARDHYAFDGWYADSLLTQKLDKVVIQDDNISVYAGWLPAKYNVFYEMNGGENNSLNPKEYDFESNVELLDPHERVGYEFVGWSDEGKIFEGSFGDKTFYALWEPIQYKITYELNGGTNNNFNPYQYTVESSSFDLINPVRRGYIFGGWFMDNKPITSISKGQIGDLFLSAKWMTNVYSITYIDAGKHENQLTYTTEDEFVLKDPTKVGYDFLGWIPENKLEKNSTENKVFQALWKPQEYNIEYVLNEGTNNLENPNFYTIESDQIILKEPVRAGYTFKGWSPNPIIDEGTTGDKKFTANWEIIDYTIRYELSGGNNDIKNPTKYTIEDHIEIVEPYKSGYTFLGWSPSSKIEKGSTEDKVFIAEWSLDYYDIEYNLNGGVNSLDNPTTYSILDAVTLKVPIKDGYDFTGWTPEGKIDFGSVDKKSFTANWMPIEYGITYELGIDGVNNPRNPKKYTVEKNDIILQPPHRKGYDFVEWLEGDRIPRGSFDNKVFTAIWEPLEYKISYDLDGGINNPENPEKYTIMSPKIVLKEPKKEGYYFTHWSENDYIDAGSIDDKHFKANWQNNVYKVIYNANGGTGDMPDDDTIIFGKPDLAELSENSFIRDGYSFLGWAKSCDAKIPAYLDKADMSAYLANNGDQITLYAVWEALSFKISYDGNGCDFGSMMPTEYIYDSCLHGNKNLATIAFIKNGNDFVGWSRTKNNIPEYEPEAEISNLLFLVNGKLKDLTLYACWNPTTYTVSFEYGYTDSNKSDFSNIDKHMQDIVYNTVVELPMPNRKGYTFEGWYLDSDFNDKLTYGYKDFFNEKSKIISSLMKAWNYYDIPRVGTKLYAKWDIITYKIKLKSTDEYLEFNIDKGINENAVLGYADDAINFGYAFKQIELINKQIAQRETATKKSTFTEIVKGSYIDVIKNSKDELTSLNNGGILEVTANVNTYGKEYEYSNGMTYEFDNGVGIIDFSKASTYLNSSYTIQPHIKQITFKYDYNKNPYRNENCIFSNFNIKIDARSTPLTICFSNFRFCAPNNVVGIEAITPFELNINYCGANSVTGGKGSDGLKGNDAIDRDGVAKQGKTGTNNSGGAYKGEGALAGGAGGKGATGAVGYTGNNGTNGMSGQAAIKLCDASIGLKRENNSSTLTFKGGDGGAGGAGGKGGKGQQGGNGGTGGNGASSFHFYLVSFTLYGKGGKGGDGGTGGVGGAGGDGGAGGNAGSALVYTTGEAPKDGDGVTFITGFAGKGGTGGAGGDGGNGGVEGIGGNGGNGNGWNVVAGFTNGLVGGIVEACRVGGNKAGDLGQKGTQGDKGNSGSQGKDGNDKISAKRRL